jgi:hypothetical protein
MARIKKYSPIIDPHLKYYETFVVDTEPNSQYFKITEFKDVFTGGKNGFLIEGSPYLMETTEIKIEILDVAGNPIYFEPGQGIPQYYEGTSKVVAVYVYEDTPIGDANITVLGELKQYFDGTELKDIPVEWKGIYNVKWQKNFKTNRLLSNEDKVRFYKRPVVSITEIVKPLFTTQLNTITQKGFVNGSPVTPSEGQSLTNYTLPTYYKLTTNGDTFWTGSVVGTNLELTDLNYNPLVNEVINSNELLVSTPYTINGIVSSFTDQRYTASFNYLEGINLTASALTGSFAKINLTDLTTFTGDVAKVKIFRKSQSDVGDYQFVQEITLEANELLIDLESQTSISETYGIFTNPIINNYWVTSSNAITNTFNQTYLYDSVKLDSPTSQYFHTSKSLSTTEDKEYSLSFNVRLASNLNTNNYIRAFLSGSKQSTVNGNPITVQIEQDITKIYSANSLLVKSTSTNNIKAQQIDNPKLYFEVVGSGWYIANVSFTSAQETAFSPDEITFIESVPRSLPIETFDYRFEFYDINSNFIPVKVEQQKTFNGGNLQNLQKSLKLNPTATYFQFDSGSNPISPTVISFNITKNLLTGSINFTSQSIDFFGNVLSASQYAGGLYPGLLNDIVTGLPYLTVQHFTGSRSDINVQYLQLTGECEGITDTIVITKVLDGFGGVNHIIRPFRGTQIRNSSTSSLEIQAVRIDGINDIQLSSTTQPSKGWPDKQLHILSRSLEGNEKFVNLSYASSSGYVKGLTSGSLGSTEINYNATFTRDSIDYRRIIYLIPSSSAASGPAYLTSASVLTSIILEDLQDGLDTGITTYNSDTFIINPRLTNLFTPTFAYATASFTTRTVDSAIVTASFQVFPSMSINKDYVPEYWMYYHTQSMHPNITVSAKDDNKFTIPSQVVTGHVRTELSQSKNLTLTFTYTEPWTSASVSFDKTFTIVPEGKPGDETIVFEVTPANVALNSNAKGIVGSYTPSNTEIKLKQGSRYLIFTGSRYPGTFYIATSSISASNITAGNVQFTSSVGVDYTASLIVSASSNFTQLSGSITYPLEIQPYYTSSVYTASVVQNYTKVVDGAPPIQVIITPSVQSLSADENATVKNYAAANTTIQLKEGSDYLIYTASGNPGTFQTSSILTSHITVSTLTGSLTNTSLLFVTGYSGMDAISASVNYNFTVYPYSLLPGHTTGSISVTGSQQFSKVNDGRASRSVTLATTSQTVNFDGDGVVTAPDGDIVLTATPFNTSGSAWYQFYKDGVAYSSVQSLNTITIGSGDATSPGEIATWKVNLRDGSSTSNAVASAEVTITGIKAGGESYNVILTNENVSAVYKVSGQLTTVGTGTTIRAYKGNTELTSVSAYTNGTYAINGDYIGSLGEFSASIDSKSSYLTLPSSTITGNPATMGDVTSWSYPTTNPTGYVVYKIDVEDGRATFYKTQSLAIQFEGNTGPGIVMRGTYDSATNYIGSVETTNYRRDAVIYGTNPVTYYASVSGSGPATTAGVHAPSGTTSDNAWWQYLGTQDFFVAAKIAIFDESYVKNTLNVGTYNDTSKYANVVIAGGRTDPYIALGQHGTVGTSGTSGTSLNPDTSGAAGTSGTGIIGYDRPGIWMGLYEQGASGTYGRISVKDYSGNNYIKWDGTTLILSGLLNAGGMQLGRGVNTSYNGLYLNSNNYWYDTGTDFKIGGASNYLQWDGTNLIIRGSIKQTSGGVNEGRVLGPWVTGYSYLQNDIVTNSGRTWTCSSAHTSGASTEPFVGVSYASYWTLAADAGTSGTAGASGTSGINGADGGAGPGVVYRGAWADSTTYYKSSTRQDVVKGSDGAYYLCKSTHTTSGTSTKPITGASYTTYWDSFGATFSSVATDVLLAQDANIYHGLVIGTLGGDNGFIRTAGATSLTAGNGFYLAQDGQFRFGNDTTLTGANYVSWNNVALTIKGQLITNNSQLGNWLVDGTILRDSTSKMKLNPDVPALEIYDGSGNKKVDIKQGSLSDPNSGAISIGIQPVSFDWDYLSANYPYQYPSYFNSSTFSYNQEYYPHTSNTLNVTTSGTYYKLSPSWGSLGLAYDTNGTFSGNVTANVYAEIHTVPNPVDYSTVVAQWHIGQGNTITGTYASGYITTLNYNSYISFNVGTYYVITKIVFTGEIYAGSLAVTGTTTPNNVNYSLSLDQIEITDEGILVVSGADNYVRIARSTSNDMITIKQNSTTKAAIVAANTQGTGYKAINVTSGDIYSAGNVTAAGRLYTLGYDTNPSGVSNDPVKIISAGPRIGELFRSSSTRRDKKDIIDWPKSNILDKIKLVGTKTFRYNNWDDSIEPTLGMIAEDLRDFGLEEAAMSERDMDGNLTGEVQSIDWEKISVILWKAVQELTERVEKLENK